MPNRFRNSTTPKIGTSNTTCYTAPASSQVTLIGFCIANRLPIQISVDASVRDFSNANQETFLVIGAPVPVGGSLIVIGGDQKVVLEEGDSVNVRSSGAESADVIISLLEIT